MHPSHSSYHSLKHDKHFKKMHVQGIHTETKRLKKNVVKRTITKFWFKNLSRRLSTSKKVLQILPHKTFYNLISSVVTGFVELTSTLRLCYKLPNASERHRKHHQNFHISVLLSRNTAVQSQSALTFPFVT